MPPSNPAKKGPTSSDNSSPEDENVAPGPLAAKVGSKRRNSWKWSPAKASKKRKLSSESTQEHLSARRKEVALPLNCVLVHYLGEDSMPAVVHTEEPQVSVDISIWAVFVVLDINK